MMIYFPFPVALTLKSARLRRWMHASLATLVLLLSFASGAIATTFVMVSDADLVEQAPLIVVGRVLAATQVQALSGTESYPATDYQIQLERQLKGGAAKANPATVTLRVPGGVNSEGVGYKIWGAPQLAPADRGIFFLVPSADGTYRSLHLMLGVFQQLPGPGGKALALRNLADTVQLKASPGGGTNGAVAEPLDLPRDFDRFANWIAARALAGGEAGATSPDYFVNPAAAAPFTKFTHISGSDGIAIRWFTFDTGGTVPWEANSSGQQGLSDGGVSEFGAAMAAWNNDPTTPIRYISRGNTSATSTSCVNYTGFGRVVFNDPQNVIPGKFSCSTGGVLAQGGPCFRTNIQRFNGKDYHPAVSAFVVTNDGISCFFQRSTSPKLAAGELFAHELGHTLGLGHSSQGSALMFANIHDDGRGASLTGDERNAINTIYGSGPLTGKPAAPSNLSATAVSSSQIQLNWTDNSNNETAFRFEQRPVGGTFVQAGSTGPGATSFVIGGLAPLTAYEFRVRAVNNAGASATSNTAGATTTAPPGFLAPPSGLTQKVLSTSVIELSWQDTTDNETGFEIQMQQFEGFQTVATVAADTTRFTVVGLEAASPFNFRVRAVNATDQSNYSNVVSTQTRGIVGPCVVNDSTLCLQGGTVRVQVNWHNQRNDAQGIGHTIVGNNKSGFFWFFNPENIELVVKSLDARTVNGSYWFFYGALSDVEYWVRVTHTGTGQTVVYRNPPFNLRGIGDTGALAGSLTQSLSPLALLGEPSALELPRAFTLPDDPGGTSQAVSAGGCVPSAKRLCLLNNRFEVEVDWINQHAGGTRGVGTSVPRSNKSGFFWFFNAENIELVVKVLDGTSVNGKFWFFYGALSDVEYTIRVRDTVTNAVRTYRNPPGELAGLGDTNAFTP